MTRAWKNRGRFLALGAVVATIAAALWTSSTAACPFCTAQALTLTEEIKAADVAVVARSLDTPKPAEPSSDSKDELERVGFEVVKVIKGEKHLAGQKVIKTLYFGQAPKGSTFVMFGYEPPKLGWSSPLALSERALKYLEDIQKLPEKGADRLVYFQDYLQDKEEMLSRDSYDEFARAPYQDVVALKSRMKHDQLVEWINSPDVSLIHRRLYFTMLSVCGRKEDVPMLERMLKSNDRKDRAGLDALVNCNLTLKGTDGLPLVEDLFIKNEKADYSDTYSAIMALRLQLEEIKALPKDRVLASLKLMLNRPNLADLVIPDLSRWEDWSAMPRLVEMFKTADEKTTFVRVPVINYLRACPKPEAKDALVELAKIDPAAMKQAESFFPFVGAPPKTENKSDEKAKSDAKPQTKAKVESPAADSKRANGSKSPATPSAGKPEPPAKQGAASATPEPVSASWEVNPTTELNAPVVSNVESAESENTGTDSRTTTTAATQRLAESTSVGIDIAVVAAFLSYWTYYWRRA
jgi:hypothetical protein